MDFNGYRLLGLDILHNVISLRFFLLVLDVLVV